MAFLVHAGLGSSGIDPRRLVSSAGGHTVTWFSAEDQTRGGAVCLSPLASIARLELGDHLDCLIVGRIRLDRRQELRTSLGRDQAGDRLLLSDADLCLQAYAKWGAGFVEHLHGDFAFVIYDNVARELIGVRDRCGVRILAWCQSGTSCWVSGSMQDLVSASSSNYRQIDPSWISDFLQTGTSTDPSRSVYADVRRLSPAHIMSVSGKGLSIRRYWRLEVDGPQNFKSPDEVTEAFHSHLNAAMLDRLPSDRVGLMMSGGLDSPTLVAKTLELAGAELEVFVSTWLSGDQRDPEAEASQQVSDYLGLRRTIVDADQLQFDPRLPANPATNVEPNLAAMAPPTLQQEALARSQQAKVWLYGEGPDNALTFEWRMHFNWISRRQQWGHLPKAIASYLATKSLVDWKTTFSSRFTNDRADQARRYPELTWIKGTGSPGQDAPACDWRPAAHRNLTSGLWPAFFERLDVKDAPFGVDWRHPYMDLRMLEFMLSTPPIPWARHKLLIRHAMKGRLPLETLRRKKTPVHRDVFENLLRQHLPPLPQRGSAVEPFVNIDRLPKHPSTYGDMHALARLVIVDRWLQSRRA